MSSYIAKPADGAVWITGASSGIGEAVALNLAAKGFTVVVTARSEDKLSTLAQKASTLSGRIDPMPGDVTDEAEMTRIVGAIMSKHHHLALAIFSAGVFIPVHAEAMEASAFHKSFAVNLSGVVNCLVPAVDAMKRAGRGQIAIISSVTGYGGLPTSSAYGATKAALTNLAESLKFDLDKMNITIQSIHPGFVDTPATKKNEFEMPALLPVEDAAERIVRGLGKPGFEVTFPRRFTYLLKLVGLLPYPLYFRIINRFTGWSDRPLQKDDRQA